MKRFENKVVVVTGAAQGIGKEVSLRMAEEGANLILIDKSELVHDVLNEIRKLTDNRAEVIVGDLSDFDKCHDAFYKAKLFFNRIDVLVNNVGGTIWVKPYTEYKVDEIKSELARTLFPTLWSCHAVLPIMRKQRSGNIVNVSSVATKGLYRVPYSAAKGGINSLTTCLAWENAEFGIRINAIACGGTDVGERRIPRNELELTDKENIWYKEMVKQTIDASFLHRFGTLSEQAFPILFFASEESSYITGTVMPVAGGDLG